VRAVKVIGNDVTQQALITYSQQLVLTMSLPHNDSQIYVLPLVREIQRSIHQSTCL